MHQQGLRPHEADWPNPRHAVVAVLAVHRQHHVLRAQAADHRPVCRCDCGSRCVCMCFVWGGYPCCVCAGTHALALSPRSGVASGEDNFTSLFSSYLTRKSRFVHCVLCRYHAIVWGVDQVSLRHNQTPTAPPPPTPTALLVHNSSQTVLSPMSLFATLHVGAHWATRCASRLAAATVRVSSSGGPVPALALLTVLFVFRWLTSRRTTRTTSPRPSRSP